VIAMSDTAVGHPGDHAKPTPTPVRRPHLAGGLEVALACDVVLAAQHATLALAGATSGLLLSALTADRHRVRTTPARLVTTLAAVLALALALLEVPLSPWQAFCCLLLSGLTLPAPRTPIKLAIPPKARDDHRSRGVASVTTALSTIATLTAAVLLQCCTHTGLLALATIQAALTLYSVGDRHDPQTQRAAESK
jgi:MFS family permease